MEEGISNIKDVLIELGYPVQDCGSYFKFPALYRGGDNPGAITLYLNENHCIDHVTGEHFSTETLISKILNLESVEKADEWLKNEKKCILPVYNSNFESIIKQAKVFPETVLESLIPDYTYFINRGISPETCKIFEGGLYSKEGKFKDRQCLLVRNSQKQIVGIVGRDITNKKSIKWKILGDKQFFVYNAFLNGRIMNKSKEVILVEGQFDILRLYDLDIKNTLCLFGTSLSNAVLNFLLKIEAKKIIIATNNDKAGENSADGVKKRLFKYFDSYVIKTHLPYKKDFGEMNDKEILEWFGNK